jgi:ribosomal protein S12 methylthiotransferase
MAGHGTSTRSGVTRVAFVSLGCPKNLVDSEKMLGTLADAGLSIVNESDGADAIVINTCGFLESSKEESLGVIRDAIERKERGELKRVVVAGCLVQRHRAKMLDWAPGIDAMIGVFDRDHVVDAVSGGSLAGGRTGTDPSVAVLPPYWISSNALIAARDRGIDTIGLTVNGADGRGVGYFEDDSRRLRLTPRHWAYLRVSEGCNQRCAFCTIPSIRGKMRSKPLDRIVAEARELMAQGAFEINLIGQDTTSYGYDIYGKPGDRQAGMPGSDRGDLIGLLHALNDVAADFGGGWMRLMYVYPTYFTDEMIDAIASLPNIVKYIDIPLQHISDRMLAAMRRNITRDQQAALLAKLRDRIPGLAIRTTFITGFPGETEADHRELVAFIEEFQFDMLGVFKYSREDNTPAGTMDLDPSLHVPDEVKEEREAEIMLTQQAIAFENMRYLGEQRCEFDVLIDSDAGGSRAAIRTDTPSVHAMYVGRTYFQAPQVDSITRVESREPLAAGELVRCTVMESDGYDLVAKPTEQLRRPTRLSVVK